MISVLSGTGLRIRVGFSILTQMKSYTGLHTVSGDILDILTTGCCHFESITFWLPSDSNNINTYTLSFALPIARYPVTPDSQGLKPEISWVRQRFSWTILAFLAGSLTWAPRTFVRQEFAMSWKRMYDIQMSTWSGSTPCTFPQDDASHPRARLFRAKALSNQGVMKSSRQKLNTRGAEDWWLIGQRVTGSPLESIPNIRWWAASWVTSAVIF